MLILILKMFRLCLKTERLRLKTAMLDTLRVAYQIPNQTVVYSYHSRFLKYLPIVRLRATQADGLRALTEEVTRLNKNLQAEWFEGPTFHQPPVPMQRQFAFRRFAGALRRALQLPANNYNGRPTAAVFAKLSHSQQITPLLKNAS